MSARYCGDFEYLLDNWETVYRYCSLAYKLNESQYLSLWREFGNQSKGVLPCGIHVNILQVFHREKPTEYLIIFNNQEQSDEDIASRWEAYDITSLSDDVVSYFGLFQVKRVRLILFNFCLFLILEEQTRITSLLSLLHFSGDCFRPQGKGYQFWSAHHKANMESLEWLMNEGDTWNLIFRHYYGRGRK